MIDLTTYDEIDPNSHLAVTTSTVTGALVTNDETCQLNRDFGLDHFNDFRAKFNIEPNVIIF